MTIIYFLILWVKKLFFLNTINKLKYREKKTNVIFDTDQTNKKKKKKMIIEHFNEILIVDSSSSIRTLMLNE